MFRSKTLFVLGAGSSCEVGLPSGGKLKSIISNKIDIRYDGWSMISGDHRIDQAIREHAQSNGEKDISPFLHVAWQLRDALPQAISIDNLLDAHRNDPKAELCGKLGIVSSILEAEEKSKLYSEPSTGKVFDLRQLTNTWFNGFVKILTEGVSKEEIGKIFENIKFLNFNYDRCIETYLHRAVGNYYGVTGSEMDKVMRTLTVIRPYGSVGTLPWQTKEGHPIVYGSNSANLLTQSSQIKTFTEQITDENELKDIKGAVQEAEIVVFLGFAYHRLNLELIRLNHSSDIRQVYGTALGISNSDQKVVEKDLRSILRLHPSREVHLASITCAELFNEYRRSLTTNVS
jgi:hypothetical protein